MESTFSVTRFHFALLKGTSGGGGLLLPASRKTACCFMLIYVVFEFSEGGVIDSIELQNWGDLIQFSSLWSKFGLTREVFSPHPKKAPFCLMPILDELRSFKNRNPYLFHISRIYYYWSIILSFISRSNILVSRFCLSSSIWTTLSRNFSFSWIWNVLQSEIDTNLVSGLRVG